MDEIKLPELKIGDLTTKLPIIQGGMSVGVSLSGLASAVAKEGGIGVIGAAGVGMLEPDFVKDYRAANRRVLKREIARAKELSGGGIIGVNIMIALTDYDQLLKVSIDEGADLVLIGAGLFLKLPDNVTFDELIASNTKIVPIVSSGRAANIIFRSWANHYNHVPDAVVVEGPLAGGHLGFKREQIDDPEYKLENLLLQVKDVIKMYEDKFGKKIPVIAAGGIFTGGDIYKFLKLGADGVQMATRFVATHECDADIKFKEAYVKCKKEDIIIIDSPVGLPGRAIRNKFLDEVSMGERKPFRCPWKCLKTCDFRTTPYCIALALTNAKLGKLDQGFAFAGANAYRVDRIVSVKELIDTLIEEYKEAALRGRRINL